MLLPSPFCFSQLPRLVFNMAPLIWAVCAHGHGPVCLCTVCCSAHSAALCSVRLLHTDGYPWPGVRPHTLLWCCVHSLVVSSGVVTPECWGATDLHLWILLLP